jgi:2,5-diketo-D-gluconate reductase A
VTGDLPLLDGRAIPRLGLGTYDLKDPAGTVEAALACGYRLIDTAAMYGNEAAVGEGLRRSGLDRDAVFVTTKVWGDRQADAAASARESLERLGLDRLDCVLIHWPAPWRGQYVEAFRQLLGLRDEGVVSSVGVSNFDASQIDRLEAECGERPVLNQVELHPRLQQRALREAMAARGVVVQSWSPLGKARDLGAVEAVAHRLGRTPAQVVLRWHLEIGASAIPRTDRPERLRENFGVWDFALSPEDHAAIAALERGERTGPDPASFG